MSHHQISIEELYALTQKREKLMILDVRSEEEFENVRIPQSHCIPLPSLTVEKMESLLEKKGFNPEDPIYVTCQTGPRAITACEILEKRFSNVYHLVGCVGSWVEENLPTESGDL